MKILAAILAMSMSVQGAAPPQRPSDPLSRQTILAFDYYLIIKDVRAASPVTSLPSAGAK